MTRAEQMATRYAVDKYNDDQCAIPFAMRDYLAGFHAALELAAKRFEQRDTSEYPHVFVDIWKEAADDIRALATEPAAKESP